MDRNIIHIGNTNVEMPKNLGSLFSQENTWEDIWDAVDSGMLWQWETRLEKDCLQPIVLDALTARDRMDRPAFMTENNGLDWTQIRGIFEQDSLMGAFYVAEIDPILNCMQRLSCVREQTGDSQWMVLRMWDIFLFLLLHIQCRQDRILPHNVVQLEQRIRKLKREIDEADRLCVSDADVRLLCDGQILCWNAKSGMYAKPVLYGDNLQGFAYPGKLGLIAFSKNGDLLASDSTVSDAMHGRAVTMASSWGTGYALLAADGCVVTNIPGKAIQEAVDEWVDIRFVSAGLRSIAGIKGSLRHPVQAGLQDDRTFKRYAALEDAASVHTFFSAPQRTGEASRNCFTILLRNGELYLDSGQRTGQYTAASLGPDGYVFSSKEHLFFYGFDGTERPWVLPDGYAVTEVHMGSGFIVCGGFVPDNTFQVFMAWHHCDGDIQPIFGQQRITAQDAAHF